MKSRDLWPHGTYVIYARSKPNATGEQKEFDGIYRGHTPQRNNRDLHAVEVPTLGRVLRVAAYSLRPLPGSTLAAK